METGKIQINSFIASFIILLLCELIMSKIIAISHLDSMIILGIIRIFESILIIFSVYKFENSLYPIGLMPNNFYRGLKTGFIWSFIIGFSTLFIFVLLILFFKINPFKFIYVKMPASYKDIIIFLCVGGIIGPIAEEIIFRGILYGFFRPFGIFLSILFSTIIFVFAHNQGIAASFPQIAGGVVFALSYEYGKSLITPIVIHVSGNMAIYIIIIFYLKFY